MICKAAIGRTSDTQASAGACPGWRSIKRGQVRFVQDPFISFKQYINESQEHARQRESEFAARHGLVQVPAGWSCGQEAQRRHAANIASTSQAEDTNNGKSCSAPAGSLSQTDRRRFTSQQADSQQSPRVLRAVEAASRSGEFRCAIAAAMVTGRDRNFHTSHDIHSQRGILFCKRCGGFTTGNKSQLLADVCRDVFRLEVLPLTAC